MHSHQRFCIFPLLLLGLTACMILAGCADPERQALRVADQLPPSVEELSPDRAWWTAYRDPELDRLVSRALEANRDLARAAVTVNRALYRANLLGADLIPTFSADLSASASKSIQERGTTSRSVGGELAVSYELDLWRRLADSVSAAEWEYLASAEDLEAARLSLISTTVDAYFNLSYLQGAITLTQDRLDRLKRINEIATARHDYGKADIVEPAQSRQAILSAESDLLDLLSQQATAHQTLRDILNLSPMDELDISLPSLLAVAMPGADLEVPVSVLSARPDLMAAEYRLQSAFRDLSATEKSWYPSITLGASLSSSSQDFRTAFDFPFAGGNIRINLPFLDWNRVYWNVRISEADYDAARIDFEEALTTALNEVGTASALYRYAGEQVEVADAKFVYDERITRYYQDRYDAGAGLLKDLLEALNTEASSRLSLLSTRYRLIQAENDLYRVMAGRYTSLP